MKRKARVVLLVLFACLPGIIGGVWAWFAASDQQPFIRVVAVFAGAAAGFFLAGLLSIVVRGIAGSAGRETANTASKLSQRDRNVLIEERQLRYAAWLRRWAAALAFAPAILVAFLTVASGLTPVDVLIMFAGLFGATWVAIRLAARLTILTVTQDREYRERIEGRTSEPVPRVDPDG
jgi:hypothetical protein